MALCYCKLAVVPGVPIVPETETVSIMCEKFKPKYPAKARGCSNCQNLGVL
jgi:hypothetical protein